jgi:hypothetical protein
MLFNATIGFDIDLEINKETNRKTINNIPKNEINPK